MYDMNDMNDDYDDIECNALDCYRVPITYKFNNWYCKAHLYRQSHIRSKIKLYGSKEDLCKEIKWREKEQLFRKDFDRHHISYITYLKNKNVSPTSTSSTSLTCDVTM